jgi:hypothetical protein
VVRVVVRMFILITASKGYTNTEAQTHLEIQLVRGPGLATVRDHQTVGDHPDHNLRV